MGSTHALAFSITADEQPLVDALNRANDHAKRSASSISSSFANVGEPFQLALSAVTTKAAEFGSAVSSAIEGGAAGIEKGLLGGVEASKAGLIDLADFAVTTFAARFGKIGKIIELVWDSSKGFVGGIIDDWTVRLAKFSERELFDSGRIEKFKEQMVAVSQGITVAQLYLETVGKSAGKAFADAPDAIAGVGAALQAIATTGLPRTEQALAAVDVQAKNVKGSLDELSRGLRSAVDSIINNTLRIPEFAQITDELKKQIDLRKLESELIGKSADEQARIRAERKISDMMATFGGREMSTQQRDDVDAMKAELQAEVRRAESAKEAIRQAEQTKNLVAYVQQQAALQEANTAEVGKTAGEIARARVEAQTNLRITKEHLTLTEAQSAELQKQYAILQEQADIRARAAFDKSLADAGRNSVQSELLALEMVGQRASEVARARFEQAELNKAVQQGIPITGELSDRIHGWGQRLRDAAEAANTAKERIDQMAQFGQIASSMLEKGFMRWTQGAKVGWQDLVGAMLIDMEKLAFKMAVLQPIFGGGASGSGLIGQIAASLFGGGASGTTAGWTPTVSIDGARAGGGDIDGGKMYLVGENGPELIRPRADATVVPSGMFGGGTSVPSVGPSVVLNITAPAGTTARETSRSQDSDGGMTIDVLFEQIEARIGGGIADGSSPVGAAIQSTFGVSRAAGAR